VAAGALPNAGAFANLEAKDRCCIESGLIYEQANAMLGLQVVPRYHATPTACYLLLQLPRGSMLLLLHYLADLFC
jgi:hypothetical protein